MIVPMKRLTLIGLKEDESALLQALQAIKAVQILPPEEGRESERVAQLESRVQRLNSAQLALRPFAPKQGLGPKPQATAQELADGLEDSLRLCDQVEELERAVSASQAEADKRRSLMAQLQPWEGLSCRVEDIHPRAGVRYITGFMQKEQIPALEDAGAVVEVCGGEKEAAVLIACLEGDYAQVSSLAKELRFKEYAFPPVQGTVQENLAALQQEIDALSAQTEAHQQALAALGKERDALLRGQDAAIIQRELEIGRTLLATTDATFILEGWVRSDQVEEIQKTLDQVTEVYYLDLRDPAEDETPPTVLKNKPLVAPYEAVTNLYSLPGYGSVDATPLFAPFYFIFFGMMLSDSAYGIVLSLGCLAFLKKLKPTGMMRDLALVLFQGGISTIIMGLFVGTFAGLSWPTVFAGTALENVFPFIDSSTDPISMLILCFALGIVHMFYGVFIAAWQCIKKGDWAGAFVDNLCWPLIIIGLLLLASPMLNLPAALGTVGQWLAILCAVVVFLFSARSKGWTVGRFISGAGKLYDITSWLGDVLSYSRIFALGLSTAVIGLVLNTLGGMLYSAFQGNMVLQVIGFLLTAVMLVFLHVFMMLISALGCFVHTARLQYVEFFGKFYDGSGKPFRPLSYKTKHVQVR